QLLSDVGLGTFLSGGIDSSLISALAAETSDRKLDSFTIGFEERSLDESKYASTVSAHLGLNHNELMMADSDLLAVVPELAEIYDEPFGDSSQIPTVALSKFARSKVTVALSGDGADELFGGYNRHTVGANLWKRARSLHKLGRWPMRSFLNILSEADFRRVYQLSAGLGFERRVPPDINQKIRKLANVLGAEDELAFYQSLRYHEHGQKCLHDPAFVTLKNQKTLQGLFSEYAMEDAMMLADMIQYLPDDIFTKVDRASMFHSLETRAPFCDPRVVTLALGLPTSRKIKSGTGKLILREILSRYVPSKMFERPKSGFAVPLAQWLRGALAPWAESVLNEELVEHEHIFDYGFISGAWASFRQGRQSEVWWLWNLITFLAWLRNYKSRVSL
ncbi:MAG: asparagine synthase C-terminal domain-containing protein, partial [Pseudomonadota bacterium]|nr:asparagine synthase C-terminal domain-containing protein [Pseudomonadota bacterium]